MDPFTTGIITLFAVTAIFYIVIFSFFYYWHQKKASFVVPPMIFTFEFLITGFLIVAIVSIAIKYIPVIIQAFGL